MAESTAAKVSTNDTVLPQEPKTPKATPANPVASKKVYESHWKWIYLGIIAAASVIMSKVYAYQTLPQFEKSRAGSIYDLLWMGLPVMVVFTLIDHGVHFLFDDWFLVNYINEEKYPDMDKRRKRCYTFTKWAFSELYYLPVSIWAYKLLLETTFMPTWLGGRGNVYDMSKYLLSMDVTQEMRYFYVLQFAKHLSRFFSHVFIRSEGNFYEYALHHGLSTFLILFSYLTNMWYVGIMVLLFHDFTDFQLILCRMFRDYKYRKEWFIKILDCTFVPVWFCGRIFFFTGCCIVAGVCTVRDVLNPELFTAEQSNVLLWPTAFMTFMMICLEGLQLFWTYYIFSSFLSVNVTTKVKHTYD